MLLALLALVALVGLFAILLMNFRSKPADKSRVSGAEQHARPRDGYLAEVSRLQPSDACARAESSLEGLSKAEADTRLDEIWTQSRRPRSQGDHPSRTLESCSGIR